MKRICAPPALVFAFGGFSPTSPASGCSTLADATHANAAARIAATAGLHVVGLGTYKP